MPRPNQQDHLCDIIGDILSLSPDCHKKQHQSSAMKTLTESDLDHELLNPKSGVNFNNILWAAFMHAHPKIKKDTDDLTVLFVLLGSSRVKAALKNVGEIYPRFAHLSTNLGRKCLRRIERRWRRQSVTETSQRHVLWRRRHVVALHVFQLNWCLLWERVTYPMQVSILTFFSKDRLFYNYT